MRMVDIWAPTASYRLDSHGLVDRKIFEIQPSEVARHRGLSLDHVTSCDQRAPESMESKVKLYSLARQRVKSSARAPVSILLARVVLLITLAGFCFTRYFSFGVRCLYSVLSALKLRVRVYVFYFFDGS